MRGVTALVCGVLASLVFCGTANTAEPKSNTIMFAGPSPYWLELRKGSTFRVDVRDAVRDGCWKTADATKNAVKLELLRSDFVVTKEPSNTDFIIDLSAAGYKFNGGCTATYQLRSYWAVPHRLTQDGHSVLHMPLELFWSKGVLIAGPENYVSNSIKQKLIEFTQLFLIEIGENQREVLRIIRRDADKKGGAKKYWNNYKID